MAVSADPWTVEERDGAAASLHGAWPAVAADPIRRRMAVCRVAGTSVVLGSTQSEAVVDRRRADAVGITVVRRSSGGGAVLVAPGDPVWVDVWVPAGDPLWNRAVDRAFDWLGQAWVDALGRLGLTGTAAHRGGSVACTRWSSLVCFGGVGTGEVVTPDGRKLVGLAQRRTRDGAWFHAACYLHWDPAPLVGVLALDPVERRAAIAGLAAAVVGVGDLAVEQGVAVPDAGALVAALTAASAVAPTSLHRSLHLPPPVPPPPSTCPSTSLHRSLPRARAHGRPPRRGVRLIR